MHRFYVDKSQININEKKILIEGSDVNHIKNVLRLKPKEKIIICDGQGTEFYCIINSVTNECVLAQIEDINQSKAELPVKIYLFQGLPKKDKMELIIQKAVELGVYEIIPVVTKRTIVKIDDRKKESKKLERWQTIATSAAKQCGRGIIPKVCNPISFQEAIRRAMDLDYNLIPYENAEGKAISRELIYKSAEYNTVGVFIGPEGGFEEQEVEQAIAKDFMAVTLGKRILRTETASISVLSIIMLQCEE